MLLTYYVGGGRQVNKSITSDKDGCCEAELGEEMESSVREGFPRRVAFRGPSWSEGASLGESQGTELVRAERRAREPALPGCLILPLSATSCFSLGQRVGLGYAVLCEGPG